MNSVVILTTFHIGSKKFHLGTKLVRFKYYLGNGRSLQATVGMEIGIPLCEVVYHFVVEKLA